MVQHDHIKCSGEKVACEKLIEPGHVLFRINFQKWKETVLEAIYHIVMSWRLHLYLFSWASQGCSHFRLLPPDSLANFIKRESASILFPKLVSLLAIIITINNKLNPTAPFFREHAIVHTSINIFFVALSIMRKNYFLPEVIHPRSLGRLEPIPT